MASESKAGTEARIEEIVEDAVDDSGASSGAETEPNEPPTAESSSAAASSTSKSKRKRAKKALSGLLKGKEKDNIPQELVNEVLQRVKHEPGAEGADADTVRAALEQMKILDVIKGKSGIGGKNQKDTGGHKFWETQPVPQIGDDVPTEDGFIEPSVPREQVRQDPYPLPKEFEWTIIDVNDEKQLQELYELLCLYYVEDNDASFRFQYTAEFLKWALQPPGYFKEWHIGVRVASNKKLVASIAGVPLTLRVRKNEFRASEINFLCIHKKLRSKRLAPILIKEVTRQCHLQGVFQAIYTGGVLLPTPVSVCRYYHRTLNVPKLVDVRFTYVPRNMTLARMIRQNKVASVPALSNGGGLREMTDADVPAVTDLYTRYMSRFGMSHLMDEADIRHHLLSGRGKGERSGGGWKGRREGQVVWAYVVENPQTKKITDFFSFYSLPSTVINNAKHNVLEAAYLFYYATEVGLEPQGETSGRLRRRLQELIGDALIIAEQANFDVFNALTLMDNVQFIEDLKFGVGDGMLNFYLYNWRTPPLAGVKPVDGVGAGKGVGIVML